MLLITDWSPGRGGSEAYALSLRDGLLAAGDEVRLLTSSAGTAGDGFADYVAFGTSHPAAQALLQVFNPWALRRVSSAVRSFRPEVAWVNNFAYHLSPAILWALGNVPTAVAVTDYKCVCPLGTKVRPDGTICRTRMGAVCRRAGCVGLLHWLRDQPRYALIRAAIHRARRVLASCRWVQRELADNGIAADHVTPPVPVPASVSPRQPAADPLFVFCGRLSFEKGAALLVRAFARLRHEVPRARLCLIGAGPERASLERLVLALGLGDAVSFTGWLDLEHVYRHLATAWALVIPSLWAEPFGLICVQAGLCGTPVIASAAGGPGQVVTEGASGLLVPNGDEDALLGGMLAIARGVALPGLTVPSEVRARLADQYRPGAARRAAAGDLRRDGWLGRGGVTHGANDLVREAGQPGSTMVRQRLEIRDSGFDYREGMRSATQMSPPSRPGHCVGSTANDVSPTLRAFSITSRRYAPGGHRPGWTTHSRCGPCRLECLGGHTWPFDDRLRSGRER